MFEKIMNMYGEMDRGGKIMVMRGLSDINEYIDTCVDTELYEMHIAEGISGFPAVYNPVFAWDRAIAALRFIRGQYQEMMEEDIFPGLEKMSRHEITDSYIFPIVQGLTDRELLR